MNKMEATEWKRAEGSIYPMEYDSFKVKGSFNEDEEEFIIQDLTADFFDEAVDVIVKFHAHGGVLHTAANTLASEAGRRRVREMYREVFDEKISLVCLKVGTNEIVGINALTMKTNSDINKIDITGDHNYDNMTLTKQFIINQSNVFNHYGVDQVVFTTGLCVVKKFRGKGIATKILEARAPLLRAIEQKVTSSVFSTIGGQKAAIAAGYEENYSIPFRDLNQKFPEMDFSFVFGSSCRVMSLTL